MTENFERIHSSGDFFELLKRSGHYPQQVISGVPENKALEVPQAPWRRKLHRDLPLHPDEGLARARL